jgi:Carboxypeptidase regulatory-like domain
MKVELYMRYLAVVFLAIVLTPRVLGQKARITGTVKDADGTPLNGAQIVVTAEGKQIGDFTSNNLGKYTFEVPAQEAKLTILCTAIVDPDKIHYETNPLKKEPPFKDYDFTFHQVTTVASYWESVTKTVDVELATEPAVSDDIVNSKWTGINESALPPDSKAAAALQFNTKGWSRRITDASFAAYVTVDADMLRLAMQGDQEALSSLPASVKHDVTMGARNPMTAEACAAAKGSWQPNTGAVPGNGIPTEVSVAFPPGASRVLGSFARTSRMGLDNGFVAACPVDPAQPPSAANSAQRRCAAPAQDMSVEQCLAAGSSLTCWYVNSVGANTKTVQLFGCFK